VATPTNLFSVFPESLAAKLFANVRPTTLAADEVLFIAGDPGDGCYRVEQGLLKVSMIAPSGAERILAIVGPGGIVGELSTIDGLPRSASVSAVRDSELTFVSHAAFQAFAEANPQVYKHLVTLLASRLRDTDGRCSTRKPFFGFSRKPGGEAFRQRQDRQACGGRGAFHRRRSR